MAIIKKEYELSIWNEKLNSSGIKTEKKGMIIGAHDMTHLGRATNIKLKREVKGTNTLTFDMPQKYFDSKKGDYVFNEFINELYNEQKIKLLYDGKWYEFYIKNIDEKKQFKSIMKSFTCKDSFIDELSRTGYEIDFSEEKYNNVDEISPFMNEILIDSVWDYRPELNIGDFTDFTEERCYKIPLEQFGGKITAYPINLSISPDDFNLESDYCKNIENFDKEKESVLENIYTKEKRNLELGDDLSYVKEIFWDPYEKDNGFKLFDKKKKVELQGKYIYVPYSELNYIYGSIIEDSYKSTEEPANYGEYGEEKGYALQPTSKDPSKFIQFIFFHEEDDVIIDESGTIVNNNCHYLIKIEDWNNILKEQLKNKNSLIHWYSDVYDYDNSIGNTTQHYEIKQDKSIIYTVNVKPNNKTIDDFTWYPVYYDGYLDVINDTDVYAARKISITNRTEFNLKEEYYTTIYNNNAAEYENLYSEKEEDNFNLNNFRVQSMEENRIVVPTLARNLIQNGTNITTSDGWEILTQSNQEDFNMGSAMNLAEINVKSTTENNTNYTETGKKEDEGISDYYLEFLSPNIEKCSDFIVEGERSSDFILNFGLTNLENGIEKDKIYAIRICTGKWDIVGQSITYRNSEKTFEKPSISMEEVEMYKENLKSYNQLLYSHPIDLKIESTANEFQTLLIRWINEHDNGLNELQKWINTYRPDDYIYLINRVYKETSTEENPINIPEQYQKEISETEYLSWIDSYIISNKKFTKLYNQDIDKIIIGQGSIDINGNYHISGMDGNNSDKCILFSDIFEKIKQDGDKLLFAGYNDGGEKELSISPIINTYYHNKENNTWSWSSVPKENSIEDNAYLLFKAKANISSPYLGILMESEPMKVTTEEMGIKIYGETDYTGVKIETKGISNEDGKEYIVSGAEYKIYEVDDTKFSDRFISIAYGLSESIEFTDISQNPDSQEGQEYVPVQDETKYDLLDGDLLSGAKPIWVGTSLANLPLIFQNLTENKNKNGSNVYALFIQDLYYGLFWLNKKESNKDDNKEEDNKEDNKEEVIN